MARSKRHKDVEYAVDDASGHQRVFKTFDEAAGFAVSLAASSGRVSLDVLCWSKAGAKAVGLEEEYDEDPDASVTSRLEISVNHVGRVA
jgi:hypothetical protein